LAVTVAVALADSLGSATLTAGLKYDFLVTGFRAEGEQCSERSDAGKSISREVFVFFTENLSRAQRSKNAAGGEGERTASPVPASQ
jgi:hypothetical protein